jgi:alkylhydroperoxidase family enzyme
VCGEGHSFLASVDLHLHSREARAALAWAESVTLVSERSVPDDVFEELQRRFSE